MFKSKPVLPRAALLDRAGKAQTPPNEIVIGWAAEGAQLKAEIDKLSDRLKEINKLIADNIGPGYTLLLDDIASIPISQATKITIGDEPALRAALGERFASLVDSTYTVPDRHVPTVRVLLGEQFAELIDADHAPTDKLKKMAADADHPERDAIRAGLAFAPGAISVKYLAPKKLPKAA